MRSAFLALIGFVAGGQMLAAAPAVAASGAPAPAEALRKLAWPASWITHPAAPKNEYGVWLFRKQFDLPAKPERFVVHVSADARYRLYVNGESVCFGPQRSDAWVWRYESVDLAPFLQAGANVVAARVVGYGDQTPYAITGVRTSLLLQGDTDREQAVNTDATWKVVRDDSRSTIPVTLPTYIVVGPGSRMDAARHPWGWVQPGFNDARWAAARTLTRGNPYGLGTDMDHWLAPRTIPLMEETPQRLARVRRAEGVEVGEAFVAGRAPLSVPANTRATVLLDQGFETNAFPRLTVSGGAGARVALTYAEALIDRDGNKGNRDEVEGRTLAGITDEFRPDGGVGRLFEPLDFRTYRYLQLEVQTANEPLQIDDLHGVFTGYPFVERGSFRSDDASLAKIWEVGWRTARLCAFETYVDCPYYEQLQYVGDTRIQALISLYVAGDDRLMRNAIELYDRSRIAEGLTQSRYPSVTPQVINTFSLFWVDMVHDYWMHRSDEAFVRARLDGVESVLRWFEHKLDPATGLLGPLDYWTFVDWTDEWPWSEARRIGGEPEGAREGGSSIVSLQFADALVRAAEMGRALGREEAAGRYEKMAANLKAAVAKQCWDEQRKLFADAPTKRTFSQHANALAVLNGLVTGDAAKALMERTLTEPGLVQASTYFRFYLLRALKAAGRGDEYLAQLGPWRTMLERGLTTFAEKPDPTRSDCHAWSASPVYELLATVCGVEPASPGFATVRIEPHLGSLPRAQGVVPHPAGEIRVAYEREGASAVKAEITLPEGVTGEFVWHGKRMPLGAGAQTLRAE
ncbi:alpha-L-rhamnosidase C-terminal domain-containing protein [Opitutus terrae]|uniref:Alpha-L-rhamnosidase n=1 Tax=Opitutus terrae (strain DSM 11246 / JCM 15787 / PB90-1) TaxID=452637 RepID=B1ZXJ6_OPITP|nr:alpha-L-rhamnosidase C-terminal domain-containing protein [Opitutus terrae]ACB76991.1 alpha-L-rhamnosidase [Opitutus terrae PB90-1]